jgi:hypothetical protein
MRKKIIKVSLFFLTFGLVLLMFGSAGGQQARNIIKLKKTGDCKKCFLLKADLKKAKLQGAILEGADLKNIRNLGSAIKCKTIFSWGEDNSGCE